MAADAGEADAIAMLNASRGMLGTQAPAPGVLPPASLVPAAGAFGMHFNSGPSIPLVRSEPVSVQSAALMHVQGSSDRVWVMRG